MATQYTTVLKLALPVTGELSGTWGDVVNDNITSMVEQAIAGLATINTWSTNSHTLTVANGTTSESRCAMLVAQNGAGLSAAGEIVCPAATKLYVLRNATSYAITLKTAAGTGVAVPAGQTMFLFCDGTNVLQAVTRVQGASVDFASLKGTGSVIVTNILDEDDMASNSATALATQQSIKAYVDAQIAGNDTLAEILANGNTTGGSDIAVSANDDITFTDTSKAIFGTGADMQIYHDGAASNIMNSGGAALNVQTASLSVRNEAGTETLMTAVADGAVTLYHNNAIRVATTSGGVDITGNATATGTLRLGAQNTDTSITTFGTGTLTLNTNAGTNSGTITIAQGVNGNITLDPNGTGTVVIDAAQITGGTINGTSVGATTPSTGNFTNLTENASPAVVQTDIGTAPNEIPLNQYLGNLAYQDAGSIAGPVVVGVNSTDAALRVTQTGTGNAFVVEDSTSPDASPFVIDAAGFQINGYTEIVPNNNFLDFQTNAKIQLHGTTIGTAMQTNFNWGTTAASPASLVLAKSKSGIIGTRGVVASGDTIGAISGAGDDGTNFITAANILVQVDGTPGTNDMPGRLVFSTTADGASSPTERTRIDSAGRLRHFGTTIVSNVDMLAASYDGVSLSIGGQEGTPSALFFSPDGRKMFVMGPAGDDVNEYNLSTPWLISSAVYSTVFSVAVQDNSPNGLFFRADGLKMYMVGTATDTVYQYALTTPWSIATASYESKAFSLATEEATPQGLFFKPDGLSMYVTGNTGDAVYQYTLTTAWDVTTASFTRSFSVVGQETNPIDLSFTGDGTRMFVLGNTGDDVSVYNLTTPWDISTASHIGQFSVSSQDTAPAGIYLKPDGTKFYMVGTANDTVYQYTVPSVEIQLTGTTSANGDLAVQQDLTVYGAFTGGVGVFNLGSGQFVKDMSGNVGIGTSSPGSKLSVQGDGTTFRLDGTPNTSRGILLRNTGSAEGRIETDGNMHFLQEDAGRYMRFSTANTERMRIDSSGNLLLGTTAGYNNGKIVRFDDTNARVRSMIVVNDNVGSSSRCGYIVNAFGNSWAMEMGSSAANSNALNWTVDIFGSPTVRMALTTGGAATNSTGSWGTISDARLKENVADATPKLNGLMQLRVVNYNLKSDPDVKMLGFVAQEVEQVFPGLVDSDGEMSEDGDRYKSVKTTVLVPMLVKAMQEQQAIIESLKARLDAANL